MTAALRARIAIVAERSGSGTRLATLRSDPPVALRPAAGAVYLAASAAGPIGGDEVHLDVTVGAGADLEVRSVAATLVLPGPSAEQSAATTVVSVGGDGRLQWLVEPTVLVSGCDHRSDIRIDLAAGAELVWREEVVQGRTGEAGGSVLQRLRIDRSGRPLLRAEHALGPRWPASSGPVGTGGRRALGTLTVVGPAARRVRVPPPTDGALLSRVDLGDDAMALCVLAATARTVREALDRALGGPG